MATWLKHISIEKISNRIILLLFVASFFLIALPGIEFGRNLPGGMGDSRFNMYIIEHVYAWLSGHTRLWNAPFYYDFPSTVAFSSNHLGSIFFYAPFRLLGFGQIKAFQLWYLIGFLVNYFAAAYVLQNLKLGAVASAVGAFIFSFNMIVLFQQGHAQLLYRFPVPLAYLALINLSLSRRLFNVPLIMFWLAWQFYIEIYTGIFLAMLISVMVLLFPLIYCSSASWRNYVNYWPSLLLTVWKTSSTSEKITSTAGAVIPIVGILLLMIPYAGVVREYGFRREWSEISSMLPQWRSYILSDHSFIYTWPRGWFAGLPMPSEHQLFLGVGVVLTVVVALVRRQSHSPLLANLLRLNLLAVAALMILTFSIDGASLYRLVASIPGLSAIRAVTRFMLVLLWPIAIVCAVALQSLLDHTTSIRHRFFALILAVFILLDSILMRQPGSPVAEVENRISRLSAKLPSRPPADPILVVSVSPNEEALMTELDAMLLSQKLRWKTLNGYTGNTPPISINRLYNCSTIPRRIVHSLLFTGSYSFEAYHKIAARVVAVNFGDCADDWREKAPNITVSSNQLPSDFFEKLRLSIRDVKVYREKIRVDVVVKNGDNRSVSAIASDQFAFRIAARWIDDSTGFALSGFDMRADLDSDLGANEERIQTIWLSPPASAGRYRVEVSAVQEWNRWFEGAGKSLPQSDVVVIRLQ